MATIAPGNGLVTPIIIFKVAPSEQQELLGHIETFLRTAVRFQPGFVSANLHVSAGGEWVCNYAQWRHLADYDLFTKNQAVQSQAVFLAHFRPDTHIYEVIYSLPRPTGGPLAPEPPVAVGLALYQSRDGAEQAQVVELVQQVLELLSKQPGFITAHLHRSLDGTRVALYSQWRSPEDFLATKRDQGTTQTARLAQYAQDEYQPVLYKLVASESIV